MNKYQLQVGQPYGFINDKSKYFCIVDFVDKSVSDRLYSMRFYDAKKQKMGYSIMVRLPSNVLSNVRELDKRERARALLLGL